MATNHVDSNYLRENLRTLFPSYKFINVILHCHELHLKGNSLGPEPYKAFITVEIINCFPYIFIISFYSDYIVFSLNRMQETEFLLSIIITTMETYRLSN